MMFEENLVSLIIIVIGVIALGFLVSDKYPLETVSITLLSALIIVLLLFAYYYHRYAFMY